MTQQPLVGWSFLIIQASRSQSDTPHSVKKDSSGRLICSTHRTLPDNTQHAQQTDIHATCGIRTRNPSKRAAADLRLRKCNHWDRLIIFFTFSNSLVPLTANTVNQFGRNLWLSSSCVLPNICVDGKIRSTELSCTFFCPAMRWIFQLFC